jgi:H+-transporting ATPase
MIELKGLTSKEAELLLEKWGMNKLPEEKHFSFILFLHKFWAPIPWMLELVILLEIILGKFPEASVIGALLIFNAALSFFQEKKAINALKLLQMRLEVQARVLRDGEWKLFSAEKLVPDDIIRLRMGDIVPADANILDGVILTDQSTLTGESLPLEKTTGATVYAGSTIKHGEAYVKVSATGKNTYYGKTAEIMASTKTPSHLQKTIFSIIKYLVAFDIILIILMFIYSLYQGIALFEILPFSLLLFVASVPGALPATYALSTALGAMELAKKGILVTRLSAIEEAAAMNILCVDKTGTITQNALKVSAMHSYFPYTNNDLMCLAAMACEESTQDPLDLAILKTTRKCPSKFLNAKRLGFTPFDPNKKYSQAIINYNSQDMQVLKGSPSELAKMIDTNIDFSKELELLSKDGSRILGIIFGVNNKYELVGLIGFQDPPLDTSKRSIKEINELGIKVIMITGDGIETAKSIATQVGIGSKAISRDDLKNISEEKIINNDIIAGVFPEDKFQIIQLIQNEGCICGMTGDGVNDAPALKKAEVGIAVCNATDVAKASASLSLTKSGLTDIVEAVKSSRRIYQRMLTYTLNKIIKTLEISVFLGLGLIITNKFIISQLLIVVLLFFNDFITMSISTDKVVISQKPDNWNIKKLSFIGGILAFFILGFSFFILYAGNKLFHLSILEIRTLIFVTLVFTGQATIYLIREKKHFWNSRPSFCLMASSFFNIIAVSFMAIKGFLMEPLSLYLILGLLISIAAYYFFLDLIKIKIFKFFNF